MRCRHCLDKQIHDSAAGACGLDECASGAWTYHLTAALPAGKEAAGAGAPSGRSRAVGERDDEGGNKEVGIDEVSVTWPAARSRTWTAPTSIGLQPTAPRSHNAQWRRGALSTRLFYKRKRS